MEKDLIGIAGSRTKRLAERERWDHLIRHKLYIIIPQYDKAKVKFISGGADSGADILIAEVCQKLGYDYDVTSYKPDFEKGYGAWKYFDRSERMNQDVIELYCFWDGQSKGTKFTIDHMQQLIKKGELKKLHVILFSTLDADYKILGGRTIIPKRRPVGEGWY